LCSLTFFARDGDSSQASFPGTGKLDGHMTLKKARSCPESPLAQFTGVSVS